MSAAVVHTRLSRDAARTLTEQVKADAAALWAKLLELYEGEAHTALGYSSWADYCRDEFDMGRDYSYKLLTSARVVEALGESTNGRPASERVARELVPVLREEPEAVEEVWAEVVEEHGPTPTAAEVNAVVTRRQVEADADTAGPRKLGQQLKLLQAITKHTLGITDLAPHVELDVLSQLNQEEREVCRQQLSAARTALSRMIGRL